MYLTSPPLDSRQGPQLVGVTQFGYSSQKHPVNNFTPRPHDATNAVSAHDASSANLAHHSGTRPERSALRPEHGYLDTKPDLSSVIRPKRYDANSGKTTLAEKFTTH